MNLPRQPEPIKVIFEGAPEDRKYIIRYMETIRSFIERQSFDNVVVNHEALLLTIFPRAVND
tara:strand:+ start:228 stop:413 length:186 start_codon:yes stop_codon:yes gene_type:complete